MLNKELKIRNDEIQRLEEENKSFSLINSPKKTNNENFDANHNETKPSQQFRLPSSIHYSASTGSLSCSSADASMRTGPTRVSVSCQTDAHPDIPYQITSPLPPIFSSELCYRSRPIFFSNSLPNLARMTQFLPTSDFNEEAEEALSEQHDRQVREFYLDERERVRAASLQLNLTLGHLNRVTIKKQG